MLAQSNETMAAITKVATDLGAALVEFSRLFLPPVAIVTGIAVLCLVLMRLARQQFEPKHLPFLVAFCLVGVVPGIIAGYSQQAIAGTFLTATIGIISAMLSYAFAKDVSETWRPVIPVAIMATLIGALAGYSAGNVQRFRWLQFDQNVLDRRSYQDQVATPVERARQLHNLELLKQRHKATISQERLARFNFPEAEALTEAPATEGNSTQEQR
jgi:hypothetical protein